MLTRAKKEDIVSNLKESIENANALFLTNLIGVSANDAVAIRKSVREAKGKVVVTRNTLFRRAAEGTYAEELLSGIKGPHAVAFSFEDAPGVAKALYDAGEENEVVDLKGGFLKEKALTVEEIKQLAKLPSRDQMLGTLLATFMAPTSAFARVLHAINEKKKEGEPLEAAGETETTAEAAPAADAPAEEAKTETAETPAAESAEDKKEEE